MKKYLAVILLSVMALPIFTLKAYSISDAECDNMPYEYFVTHSKKKDEKPLLYLVGENGNKGKYKQEALEYCSETKHCPYVYDQEFFFGDYPLEDSVEVNYPTFALFLNNKVIFEALITEGGLGFLIDDGIYGANFNRMNGYFETPALLAVRYSQVGILKYLLKNYDINLYRLSGYLYKSTDKPQKLVDAYGVQAVAEQYWKERGIAKGTQCAAKVRTVLDNYFKEHEKDADVYKKAVDEYNTKVKAWAEIYRVNAFNNFPMRRGMNVLDVLQPEKENYASNDSDLNERLHKVEKEIDYIKVNILMHNIMNSFDLSVLGNKKSA